ncbi:stage V sporulation protein AE [Neobacillus dielmonensis]|uniref:stage V sporulation protein AE n=1 Tax=Neobacillus dielmonensis TaxID=1347369 RepID=UPI0005AA8B86|nr:stage V sporulation protein AE [Neobacillus dielmonensis]
MTSKRRVILVTDGDEHTKRTLEGVAVKMGGRCISASQGNPSLKTGPELVELIKEADHDPVLVMFDDSGIVGEGQGESALKYVASHKDIEVLGVLAVAAKSRHEEWSRVDVSIDRDGNLTPYGVDKFGVPDIEMGRIYGDTVYCLDELDVPIKVGIGDIGKMARHDSYKIGSPITEKAVQLILERSGFYDRNDEMADPGIGE